MTVDIPVSGEASLENDELDAALAACINDPANAVDIADDPEPDTGPARVSDACDAAADGSTPKLMLAT